MIIDEQALTQQVAELKVQLSQLLANAHAVQGAIQLGESLLQKGQPTTPLAEEV